MRKTCRGLCLQCGNYEHLMLPMEFDPDRKCYIHATGWSDPRRERGGFLWAKQFGAQEVTRLKAELRSSYAVAGQLQQRPAPRGGGMIQMAWFLRIARPPTSSRVVQSWDTANKAKEENAPWVCTTWIEYEDKAFLADVFRRRMEYPEGKKMVYEMAAQWEPDVVLIEDKSRTRAHSRDQSWQSAESESADESRRETAPAHIVVIAIEPDADKVTRMATEVPTIEAGEIAFLLMPPGFLSSRPK